MHLGDLQYFHFQIVTYMLVIPGDTCSNPCVLYDNHDYTGINKIIA